MYGDYESPKSYLAAVYARSIPKDAKCGRANLPSDDKAANIYFFMYVYIKFQ